MKRRKSDPQRGVYVLLACILLVVLASVGFLMYALSSRNWFSFHS